MQKKDTAHINNANLTSNNPNKNDPKISSAAEALEIGNITKRTDSTVELEALKLKIKEKDLENQTLERENRDLKEMLKEIKKAIKQNKDSNANQTLER